MTSSASPRSPRRESTSMSTVGSTMPLDDIIARESSPSITSNISSSGAVASLSTKIHSESWLNENDEDLVWSHTRLHWKEEWSTRRTLTACIRFVTEVMCLGMLVCIPLLSANTLITYFTHRHDPDPWSERSRGSQVAALVMRLVEYIVSMGYYWFISLVVRRHHPNSFHMRVLITCIVAANVLYFTIVASVEGLDGDFGNATWRDLPLFVLGMCVVSVSSWYVSADAVDGLNRFRITAPVRARHTSSVSLSGSRTMPANDRIETTLQAGGRTHRRLFIHVVTILMSTVLLFWCYLFVVFPMYASLHDNTLRFMFGVVLIPMISRLGVALLRMLLYRISCIHPGRRWVLIAAPTAMPAVFNRLLLTQFSSLSSQVLGSAVFGIFNVALFGCTFYRSRLAHGCLRCTCTLGDVAKIWTPLRRRVLADTVIVAMLTDVLGIITAVYTIVQVRVWYMHEDFDSVTEDMAPRVAVQLATKLAWDVVLVCVAVTKMDLPLVDLWARKLRLFVTVTILAVGVAGYVAVPSVNEAVHKSLER